MLWASQIYDYYYVTAQVVDIRATFIMIVDGGGLRFRKVIQAPIIPSSETRRPDLAIGQESGISLTLRSQGTTAITDREDV